MGVKQAARLKLRFTDAAIRALPPLDPGQAERLAWDEAVPGLALRLGKVRRSWIFVYRPPGSGRSVSPQKIGIGAWPAVSVDAARRAAQIEAGRIARGENPAAERRESKRKEKATVAAALDEYERGLKRRKYANLATAMSTLRRGLEGIATRDVSTVTRRELVDILERIESRGKAGAAADLRKHVRTFLEWTTNRGLTAFNVLAGLRRERATRAERIATEERGRALSAVEIKEVWKASDPETVFGRFVRALIITGARRGEMAGLERGMLSDDRLRLPPSHTKQGRAHEIPLTPLLRTVLDACPVTRSALFFASPSTGREIGGWTQLVAKLRERSGVDFTLHDLRRTMRSGLSALDVSHDVAELALGHQRDDLVRRYDKDDRWSARVAAATGWSTHLERLTSGTSSTVIECDPLKP